MSQEYETLNVDLRDNDVAHITIERPDKLNAINTQMLDDFSTVVDRLEGNNSARSVLLTGAEGNFSVGADIESSGDSGTDPAEAKQRSRYAHHVLGKLRHSGQPVVAGIEGYCLGGGMELSMCADLRVASAGATFALPEQKLGVLPNWGGTQRLPRIVGEGRAKEIILTGEQYEADKMEEYGFLNDIVPDGDFLSESMATAAKLASGAPLAHKHAKDAIHAALPEDEAGFKQESRSLEALVTTADYLEGAAAFQEGRDPNFQGK